MSAAERAAIEATGQHGDSQPPVPLTNEEIRRQLGWGLINQSAECAR